MKKSVLNENKLAYRTSLNLEMTANAKHNDSDTYERDF